MLTENYIKKINPLIKLYKFTYKFRYLLITTGLLMAASAATLMSIKGVVYKDLEVKNIVYGQKLDYQASSIFSDTTYEFRKVSESTWTQEEPVNAGEYEIRAVGKNIFGMQVHGNAHKFTIAQKEIKPSIVGNSYMYGENPLFTFELAYEDELVHQGYHYEGLSTIPMYAFEENDFLIVDKDGRDVTANYKIDLSSINATLTPRGITVKINESKGYDGKPLVLEDDFDITNGSLVNNDYIVANKITDYINAGTYKPEFTLSFNNSISGDVSKLYNYSFTNDSVCEIEKRPLTISTESLTKTYDGIATNLNNYTITDGSLVAGDTLDIIFNQYVDVGEYQNEPYYYKIYDSEGNDTTNNYDISFNYGNVVIEPQEIEITTSNAEFTYNGNNQATYDYEITKGKLVNGDQIMVKTISSLEMVNKGEYQNELDFDIINANLQSNIKNYDVTIKYGTIKINPINLTIDTPNIDVTYGESLNLDNYSYSISTGELAAGDLLSVTKVNIPEKAGAGNSYSNEIEVKVYHNGNLEDDRTSNYNISYNYGKINILKRPLELVTLGSDFFYQEGCEFSFNKFDIVSGSLAFNDILKGIDYTTISEIGTVPNVITPLILDEYGDDVTSNYDINISNYENLTVKEDTNITPPPEGDEDNEDDIVDNNPNLDDNDYKVNVDLEINGGSSENPSTPPEDDDEENPVNPGEDDDGNIETPENPDEGEIPDDPTQDDDEGDDTQETVDPNLLFTYESTGNNPIYLRQEVYGNYFNGNLYQAKKYSFDGTSYFDPNLYVGNLIKDNKEIQEINLTLNKEFSSGFIPYYLASEASYYDNDVDVNFNNAKTISYSYYEYNYLNEGINPANLDYISQNNLNYLNYKTFVNNNYLKVDASLKATIQEMINENNLVKETEFDSIYSVGRYLKNNYIVGTNVNYSSDTDIISQFLTEDKEGKHQHFATAGAMILRTIGIPARVVSGYYLDNKDNTTNGEIPVYKNSADHVWVEAYSSNLNAWVNVDFTPAYAIDYTPETPSEPDEPDIPDDPSSNPDDNPSSPGGSGGQGGEGGSGDLEGDEETPGSDDSPSGEEPDEDDPTDEPVEDEFPRDEIKNIIYIKTGTKSFTYDGKLHKYENYSITSGELLPYDEIEVNFYSSILNYGTVNNRIDYKVYDTRNNKDVTSEYQGKIFIIIGTLSIEKAPLTVTSNSLEKVYDGTPLSPTIDDITYNPDELQNNDYISEVIFYNIKSERGTYVNLFEVESIRKTDSGANAISNYSISYSYGTIRII